MGYTHYWERELTIDHEEFNMIVADFLKIMPKLEECGVKLADGLGEGEPVVNSQEVWFNGKVNCGHPRNTEMAIPWPTDNAGGINSSNISIKGSWFAGAKLEHRCCDGDCSCETFYFPQQLDPSMYLEPENEKYFCFCKTAFRPYDLAVTVFLIIAKHYLKEKIIITSDGEQQHWFDAQLLCQIELGYGLNIGLKQLQEV